jgi:hypothetical protein
VQSRRTADDIVETFVQSVQPGVRRLEPVLRAATKTVKSRRPLMVSPS